jgi:AraC family transcriptional regulator, exoenzyme S synthesis regulatory protein ExsA
MVRVYELLKAFPSMSRRLQCRDLMFTQYDCPQTEKKAKFYVEQHAIAYVISGKRVLQKNKKKWVLDKGACVLIKKGTHISEIEDEPGWCVMTFFMPDDFLKKLITEYQKDLPMSNQQEPDVDHILPLHVNDTCRSFFTSMMSYFAQEIPPPENLLELKFKELVLCLVFETQNQRLLAYLRKLSDNKYPSLEDVVRNNYTFNLTLTDYANLACMSVPTFKREFKRIFNESPARWVMKKRLDLAAELLENTSLSIGEITFECGFENQTHFSRIFKEKMGVSPLRFRMKLAPTHA